MKDMNFPLLIIFLSILFCSLVFAEENTIKIGWIGPLTGNAAVLGVDSANVLKDEFEKINYQGGVHGKKLELIVQDDAYETKKTVAAYNYLVHSENVRLIVALTYNGLFAISELAEKDQVLLIDPLDCDEDIAKLPANTFCIAKMTEDLPLAIIDDIVKEKLLPVGIIYFGGDSFPVKMYDESIKKLKERNINDFYVSSYLNDATDFRAILTKFRSKQIKSLVLYGYDNLGTVMHQARNLGIKSQFYATATLTSPGHMAAAKGADEGTKVAVWQAPRSKAYLNFIQSYHEKYHRRPFFDISTVPSYDIAYILHDLLSKQSTSDIDVSMLRKDLYNVHNYQGLSGTIAISSDGVTRSFSEMTLKVFQNGKINLL